MKSSPKPPEPYLYPYNPSHVSDTRTATRRDFVADNGWIDATLVPLPQDASFRHYYRLVDGPRTAMVMDAPPDKEPLAPFVAVTRHLQSIGARVPQILASDYENGFLMLEDLGDDTFTRLLEAGMSEAALYERAEQALYTIQQPPPPRHLPPFDFNTLYTEAELMVDWYYPARFGSPLSDTARAAYRAHWQACFAALPALPDVFVHRDFHVDNLLLTGEECAMLDYQDARTGSPAYDVISLIEDERRDVDPVIVRDLAARFCRIRELDEEAFAAHLAFWSVHRHNKNIGIFMRLWKRDDKPDYLRHLPRMFRMLHRRLKHPLLAPLAEWFQHECGGMQYQPLADSPQAMEQAEQTDPA